MHPTYQAAFDILRDSFDMFSEALDGLPDAAFDWTPVAGTSSIAILVTHSITSTRFWLSAGAGLDPDREAYFAEHRPTSFRVRGGSAAAFRNQLADAVREFEGTLAKGTGESLMATLSWTTDSGSHPAGAECLFRAIGHLREHVGQAMLMRDIWLAGSREGH
ncbi:MAG: DinB family protein [Hyphomicrobiales bacterium]